MREKLYLESKSESLHCLLSVVAKKATESS